MARAVLMVKALVAFLVPGAYTNALAAADHALELSRNQQLQAAGSERQQAHHRDTQGAVLGRLQLLRGRVVKSLLFIASAVFAAGVVAWLPSSRPALLTAILPIASVSLFAWATLGRLGWAGQSWKGDTVVERLDQVLFWASYWLGTFCGVLAII